MTDNKDLCNDIRENFDIILSRYQKNKDYLYIFDNFVNNKMELIICNHYQKLKRRKDRELRISTKIDELYSRFDKIFYNQFIDCFYILNNYKLGYLNYDSLTLEINNIIINSDFLPYKSKIHNQLKKKLSSRTFYNIPVSDKMITNVSDIFKDIFISKDVLYFFLFFIGSCLNGMDYELFKGNIIFYGDFSIDLIELLKYNIYEITKLYIRSLTDIKFRYNNYDLRTAKLFHVSINDFGKFKRAFKNYKELFIVVCNHYYQNYQEKFLNTNIEPVFFLNKFETKEDLFKYYKQECILVDKEQQFRAGDIITDFNYFLDDKKLPVNIISKKELNFLIQNNLESCSSNKNVYSVSLKNFSKKQVCLKFFESEVVLEDPNIISINQLHYFFEKWFQEQKMIYNCPMKMDLKQLLNSKNIDTKENYYKNIRLLSGFDKKSICLKFIRTHITNDEEKIMLLLDLKSQFDLWYQQNYVNYPILEMYDLKYYTSLTLKKYDSNIFGWKGFLLNN